MKSWTIGNSPECDIVVAKEQVSGKHCRLSETPDGFQLQDLESTNGVYVNGNRVSGSVNVTVNDEVTLGTKFAMPWPPEVSLSGRRFVTIGSAIDNDIVIDEPMVSSKHARLVASPTQVLIEDLGSTNGLALDDPARQVRVALVSDESNLFFGSYKISGKQLLSAITDEPNKSEQIRASSKATLASADATLVDARLPDADTPAGHNYFMIGLISFAFALIGGIVVILLVNNSGRAVENQEETNAKLDAKGDGDGVPKENLPINAKGFQFGKFNPDDIIQRIEVSIRVGKDGQSLAEPVDLDFGAGFLLRVSPIMTAPGSSAIVAFPQKISGTQEGGSVSPGSEASFEFSSLEEKDAKGGFSKTPQVLSDFSFSQILGIRFGAAGKANWVLEGYTIKINGQLFASHDSVQWRVRNQAGKDQSILNGLVKEQEKLKKEISELKSYIEKFPGNTKDQENLAAKVKKEQQITADALKLRGDLRNPNKWYTENDPAFTLNPQHRP